MKQTVTRRAQRSLSQNHGFSFQHLCGATHQTIHSSFHSPESNDVVFLSLSLTRRNSGPSCCCLLSPSSCGAYIFKKKNMKSCIMTVRRHHIYIFVSIVPQLPIFNHFLFLQSSQCPLVVTPQRASSPQDVSG